MEYPNGVKEELDRITAQEPDRLSDEDVAYIKARIDYLEYGQLKKFEKVLGKVEEPKTQVDIVVTEEPKQPAKRKGK